MRGHKLDRAAQRALLSVTAGAMVVALLLAAGFTLAFARGIGALHLAVSLLWLMGLVIFVWIALVGRILPVRDPHAGPAWYQMPWLLRMACGFAAVSLIWMVTARMSDPYGLIPALHWPMQLVLGLSLAGLAGWTLFRTRRANDESDREAVLMALEQRERLLRGIVRLSESSWLDGAEPLSTRGRLRTTLRWWGEELSDMLPNNGQALMKIPYNRIAYEADRLLIAIQDLGRSNEQDEKRIGDAEIEILSAIEASSTLISSAP